MPNVFTPELRIGRAIESIALLARAQPHAGQLAAIQDAAGQLNVMWTQSIAGNLPPVTDPNQN